MAGAATAIHLFPIRLNLECYLCPDWTWTTEFAVCHLPFRAGPAGRPSHCHFLP